MLRTAVDRLPVTSGGSQPQGGVMCGMIRRTVYRLRAEAERGARPAARRCAVALGLVGCGGSADTPRAAGTVRDFRAVQVGPTLVENEGGTEAVIRVTTDPATVCAVAFGKSKALGRIANDPNMGGTAITEHAVCCASSRRAPATCTAYRDRRRRPRLPDAGDRTFETKPAEKAAAGAGGPDLALHAEVVDAAPSTAAPSRRQTRSTATSRRSGRRTGTGIAPS